MCEYSGLTLNEARGTKMVERVKTEPVSWATMLMLACKQNQVEIQFELCFCLRSVSSTDDFCKKIFYLVLLVNTVYFFQIKICRVAYVVESYYLIAEWFYKIS